MVSNLKPKMPEHIKFLLKNLKIAFPLAKGMGWLPITYTIAQSVRAAQKKARVVGSIPARVTMNFPKATEDSERLTLLNAYDNKLIIWIAYMKAFNKSLQAKIQPFYIYYIYYIFYLSDEDKTYLYK